VYTEPSEIINLLRTAVLGTTGLDVDEEELQQAIERSIQFQ
jgi:hypothetical protein